MDGAILKKQLNNNKKRVIFKLRPTVWEGGSQVKMNVRAELMQEVAAKQQYPQDGVNTMM